MQAIVKVMLIVIVTVKVTVIGNINDAICPVVGWCYIFQCSGSQSNSDSDRDSDVNSDSDSAEFLNVTVSLSCDGAKI